MNKTYTIYLKDNEVQKLKTLKSYTKYRLRILRLTIIRKFWAYIDQLQAQERVQNNTTA